MATRTPWMSNARYTACVETMREKREEGGPGMAHNMVIDARAFRLAVGVVGLVGCFAIMALVLASVRNVCVPCECS